MKVLVCGDRNWTDFDTVMKRLSILPKDSIIIQGGCRGADRMSLLACNKLGLKCMEVKADWEKHGRSAGPIRNRVMLDMNPELVIAFHDDLMSSKGTRDTVTEAMKRGIMFETIGSNSYP